VQIAAAAAAAAAVFGVNTALHGVFQLIPSVLQSESPCQDKIDSFYGALDYCGSV
jgi:hypothetical protein